MKFESSLAFAQQLDSQDKIKALRDKFFIPQYNERNCIYFCGNSLGLQPRSIKHYLDHELEDWAKLGVHGHVQAKNPWVYFHKILKKTLADITGALPEEVVAMNNLTTNLHLSLVSFYRPSKQRYKVIMEQGAFSSDQYAIESQVRLHGLDPDATIVEIEPRAGEYTLRTEDILEVIYKHRDEVALLLLGGVNYYTGQAYDMKAITKAGHKAGAYVAFDLAHAIGNIKLQLHDWNVDFAVWCSYKYLNSGPGGIGGMFVHKKFADRCDLSRFAGWWGHNEDERFNMEKGFKPISGVDGWQLSNVPVLLGAAHKASLDIFDEVGMDKLLQKSKMLTGYLEYLLLDIQQSFPCFKILTPVNAEERGAQLSLLFEQGAEKIFKDLSEAGVVVDMRRPNVIRVTPVPLYNTFVEVYEFYKILKQILIAIRLSA